MIYYNNETYSPMIAANDTLDDFNVIKIVQILLEHSVDECEIQRD